jgi:hypothetical protein
MPTVSDIPSECDNAPVAVAPVRHPNRPKKFLTRAAQAKRYSKSKRTIERWGRDPKMRMPVEYWFNQVPHRLEEDLEVWDAERCGTKEMVPARRSSVRSGRGQHRHVK